MDVFAVEAFAASWIEIVTDIVQYETERVEAFAASWIEIENSGNMHTSATVEAFAASWIEMLFQARHNFQQLSKPLRLRGLKLLLSM